MDTDELVRALAENLLGRDDVSGELARETAGRLEGLMQRLRSFDESVLGPGGPSFAYEVDHPYYSREPVLKPGEWIQLADATHHGTGYGGTRGLTGAAGLRDSDRHPVRSRGNCFAPARDGLAWMSLTETAQRISNRELSPVEVTRAALDRIHRLDTELRSFVTVTAERALEAARRAEDRLMAGDVTGPLHGVPVALKDLYETAGVRTTAGSKLFADYVPDRDATTVRRLVEAGAIVVGKTATHEFAFGATTDSPYHGPVHNPWKLGCVPGGSSGGSGAAVASGLVACAMGTDTGGSIRIPASACGVVGLKPTYGRISRAGIVPLSWSLDHPGPLTRTVGDAAIVLQVLAGPDPLDPAASRVPVGDYTGGLTRRDLRGIRLAVPEGWLDDRIDGEVREAVVEAIGLMSGLGAAVEYHFELPESGVMTLVNRLIALGEAAAYHAPKLLDRAGDYGEDVRARLELGQFLLARDYLLGQRLRTELTRWVNRAMVNIDALVLPTIPFPAPAIGQRTWHWQNETETVPEGLIRLTAPFNVTGQPALSLPCGRTGDGLPVGLQLVGRPFEEASLLAIAAVFEHAGGTDLA